jgi:hypothetical protein
MKQLDMFSVCFVKPMTGKCMEGVRVHAETPLVVKLSIDVPVVENGIMGIPVVHLILSAYNVIRKGRSCVRY